MNISQDNDTSPHSGKIVNKWHPLDYGFYYSPEKENMWLHRQYELRSFPNDMWLLRRKMNKDDKQTWSIKFYYMIKQEDVEFADWLLRKRLNKY
jgi:hypothetical protein